jgi:single-stranded-DNA-specific exonuclease
MLNYQLIGDNDYIFDPIGTIFANRGIDDADTFMNLTKDVTHHYSLLKNIDIAIDCLIKHIERDSNILIVVDPDVDGFSSATIIYEYIRLLNEKSNIKWILHDDKSHGIDKIDIPEWTNLLILPDSGSEDFDRHKELNEKGIDIIVLDHHEVERESEHAIIVNPQLGGYPNLNLSGAGIVLKFCEALDDKYSTDFSGQFYDLVALGNVADSMSMSELETRYYVQEGLKDISNNFFNALVRKQDYSIGGKVNITAISFFIAPLINSVIRVSNISEKVDMFKAFLGVKELIKYKPRGGEETLVPLVDDVARRCANARAKQNRIRDKIINQIEEIIQEKELYKNKVIFISDINIEEKELTGLVANVIASKYKRGTLILSGVNKDGYGSGSGRGYDKGGLKDFKSTVLNTNLFEFAKGHSGAFGIKIHKNNFNKVNDALNLELSNYSIENKYTVDFEVAANLLNDQLIYSISELESAWGKNCDEPYLAVKDIPIEIADISLIGKNEDTISIFYKGIKYMIFKTNEGVYSEIIKSKYLTAIGKSKVNTYKDVTTPQILIDDFYCH